ncbi:sugar kinase [Marinoscillum furvescens]|uniref:2-dehydro-3-deoxygluconokinase n=1 Tax=Marinoscillum furvescens DSM 4134 TaxID=1122208 RepID=A0A3D9L640_MARFU|nr:sugar kinase [Marinoscillum furvescens]REE00196.1 2-dehydro-3-deoxygluconokinase [Marinoscillum furvescens DSM 4134]
MSFVTFGEIMLRLTPSDIGVQLDSSAAFNVDYAGAEANVASSLGILGNQVSFITKLPPNKLGEAAIRSLRSYGINTDRIWRGGERMGTYFIELGSSIRPSSVIYDRKNSAISQVIAGEVNWEELLKDFKFLFITGITPALSDQCAKETILAAQTAKRLGLHVGFDMNFRRSLWNSPDDARKIFDELLASTDILFCNTGVLNDIYQLEYEGADALEQTSKAIPEIANLFSVDKVVMTVREHLSASENQLSGLLYQDKTIFSSNTYLVNVTDRFGTGDAFVAAFLHGYNSGWNPNEVINFATAAFALKHTIKGDQHTSSEQEIRAIMEGHTSGHVLR